MTPRDPTDLSELARFERVPDGEVTTADIGPDGLRVVPAHLFGNFFEHMASATYGGIAAELLLNPTFHRRHHLSAEQRAALLHNGAVLDDWARRGDNQSMDQAWCSWVGASGFGNAFFDDESESGVPLPWAKVGAGAVLPNVGRVGHAVRLTGTGETLESALGSGPTGLRQVVFPPAHRTGRIHVTGIARITSEGPGTLEISLRRRDSGAPLAVSELRLHGEDWRRFTCVLEFDSSGIRPRESVDFVVRWLASTGDDLQLDRISAVPDDAIDVFDPDVLDLARGVTPELRWPGGNFVSYYRWQHGVGPAEDRPTVQNQAWGGIELNTVGTDEFLALCAHLGAQPHITVNAGTGTSQEAAAWVEYCNGSTETPMGSRRAANGHPEPYNVTTWEVGNELWGEFQGGNVGGELNARRFAEFAAAMRASSPIPLRLLATGNWFDLVDRSAPQLGYASVDGVWQSELMRVAADDVDAISMHWLPITSGFLPDDAGSDELANRALLAQLVTAERHQLPRLIEVLDRAPRRADLARVEIALTEWCPLGATGGSGMRRLSPDNFGAVIWAAALFHTIMRRSDRLTSASPNGFLHGGSIKKVAGCVYRDPSVELQERYLHAFAGGRLLPLKLAGPGFDVPVRTDLSAAESDLPFVDVAAVQHETGLVVAALNRDGTTPRNLEVRLPAGATTTFHSWAFGPADVADRATFAQPDRFSTVAGRVTAVDGVVELQLPPHGVLLLDGRGGIA